MKKFLKWFISLAAIGSAIGLIIAYFCKDACCDDCCDDSQDFTEEDDFDLDSDLEPVPERDYVPLHRNDVDETATGETTSVENMSDTKAFTEEIITEKIPTGKAVDVVVEEKSDTEGTPSKTTNEKK